MKLMILAIAAAVILASAPVALAAEKASSSLVPVKPQAVGAACQESLVCASGLCIEGKCADALTACKATAAAGTKACPEFSGQAFKPVPLTSPACAATALALKLPSAATAANACYRAGEGEVCVVSAPKKQGGPVTYGVVCNGLATADAAAVADAPAAAAAAAAAPAAEPTNGAEPAGAGARAAVVAGVAGLVAAAMVL